MKKLFIATFLIAYHTIALAQQGPPPPKEITAEQKKEIIEAAADRLSKNYILPDIAKKYADQLRSRLKSGAYDNIQYAHIFADSVKSDLYKVYKDKHLNVSFNPNMEQNLINIEKGTAPPPQPNPAMEKKMNAAFKNVSIRPGNIGYVRFDGFVNPTEVTMKAVDQALGFVANTDALIIDLRFNGGGSPKMVEYISSYLFDKPTHINSLYQRDKDTTIEYWTKVVTPNLANVPVFILTSNNTFSAAEEFTYNLKNLKRAVIVGENTKGGAHPVRPFSTTHGIILNIPFAKAVNPISKNNWEGTGIAPDVAAESYSALDVAYAKALEQLAEKHSGTPLENYFKWHATKVTASLNKKQWSQSDIEKIAGKYGPVTIEMKGGQLVYKRVDFGSYALQPLSENILSIEAVDNSLVEILKDASGAVTGIKINFENGQSQSFKKENTSTKTF